MSAPRSVFQSKAGRSKAQHVPVTKQSDRHTQLAGLLLKAEQAPDSLERMLAVCRVLLCWLTDLMRGGKSYGDTPVLTLGFHALSHRELPARHRGDLARVYLQEAVSYEAGYKPTLHPKYGSGSAACGGALGAGGKAAEGAGADLAFFKVGFVPVCSAKTQRAGLLGGAGAPYVECALEGSGNLSFERHVESYSFTLPALVFTDPLAEECPLDLDGTMEVRCAATGLTTELRFKPFRQRQVKGYVSRLVGEGAARVAAVKGDWGGAVEVTGLQSEGTGVLFDPSQLTPAMSPSVSLAEPGLRATPRLWAAILQALTFIDPAQAAQAGRRAEQLAAALPAHMSKALGYEPQEPSKASAGKGAAAAGGAAKEEGSGAAAAGAAGSNQRHVPPCLEEQGRAGRRPQYFVQYLVQAVPQE